MTSLWKDVLKRIRSLRARLAGPYQPEKHYMRGPGPRSQPTAKPRPATKPRKT